MLQESIQYRLNRLKDRIKFSGLNSLSKNDLNFLFRVINLDDYIMFLRLNYIEILESRINNLEREIKFRTIKAFPECLNYCKEAEKCKKDNYPQCK